MNNKFHVSVGRRISTIELDTCEDYSKIPDKLLELNNGWAKPFYQPLNLGYVITNPNFKSVQESIPIHDNYNISQQDKDLENEIEAHTVIQFLNRLKLSDDVVMRPELSRLDLLAKSNRDREFGITVPKPINLISCRFVRISLSNAIYEDELLSDYCGSLSLYDNKQNCVCSETVYFANSKGRTTFSQTGGSSAVFEIRQNFDDLSLVCVLFHHSAIQLDKFLSHITQKTPCPTSHHQAPVPFAASSCKLSSFESKDHMFDENWVKVTTSDVLKVPLSGSETLKIAMKFSAELVEYDEIEGVYSSDNERTGKTLIVMPIPNVLGHPRVAAHLYGMQVAFSGAQKAELVSVQAYFCRDLAPDCVKPIGVSVFSVKNNGETLAPAARSWPVPCSKRVLFPEMFQFALPEGIDSMSHIIFHIMTWDRRGPSVNCVAILPLWNENGPIESGTYVLPTCSPSSLRGTDYLSKAKSTGKTMFTVSVDIPSVFCPPKVITKFAEAETPEQQVAVFPELLELHENILKQHYVPISHRLLLSSTTETLDAYCQLSEKCWGEKVPTELRSSLYHCCDMRLVSQEAMQRFALALCDLADRTIETKNISRMTNCFSLMLEAILLMIACNGESSNINWGDVFNKYSELICAAITMKDAKSVSTLTRMFSTVLLFIRSLAEFRAEKVCWMHVQNILKIQGDDRVYALECFFEAILIFTQSIGLMTQVVTQMPVRPLSDVMFSPYHPFLSVMFFVFKEALSMNQDRLTNIACEFFCKLCLPLETSEDRSMIYRYAYALFPLLDIISTFYESSIKEASRSEVVPIVMFLLAYTPAKLLQNYFATLNTNFRVQFIQFLGNLVYNLIRSLRSDCQTYLNRQFCELTQRIVRFLLVVFPHAEDCDEAMIELISMLVSNYQTPRNYPRLFDITARIIGSRGPDRKMIHLLVGCMEFNVHIVRCFACSCMLLFFKKDFEVRNNVIVSTASFLDGFVSALLNAPVQRLVLYKQLVAQIQKIVPFFQNDAFTAKLSERLTESRTMAEVIEKLRLAQHPPALRAVYSMKIADQNRNFPSHRMKWLNDIVHINVENGWYSSAFVAQAHICALVATVVGHYREMPAAEPKDMNLLVTQPMNGLLTLLDKQITFIPAVATETALDFAALSDEFEFVISDFTEDLLVSSLKKAAHYAMTAHLYYDARAVYSALLRHAKFSRNWTSVHSLSNSLAEVYNKMSANESFYPDCPCVFYAQENRIYCHDRGTDVPADAVQVFRFDKERDTMEFPHSFSIFRTRPSEQQLIEAGHEGFEITQYTTTDALPRYTIFSTIAEEKTVKISLLGYVKMEAARLEKLMRLSAKEFEKFFPVSWRNLKDVTGNFKINIGHDLDRITCVLRKVIDGDTSLFALLRKLMKDGRISETTEIAARVRDALECLIQVYHSCIEFLQSAEHFIEYKKMLDLLRAFTDEFGLQAIDTKSYEGPKDPLTSNVDYDVF